MKNLNKKRALVAVLAMCLTIVGISAYFTDAKLATNTFTVGNVSLELQEPSYPGNDSDEAKDITPLKEIPKDPQVKNTGSNDEFIFLTVTIPFEDIKTENLDGSVNKKAITEIFSVGHDGQDGIRTSDWVELESLKISNSGESVTRVYAYVDSEGNLKSLKSDETTAALFDYVKVANIAENVINTTQNIVINAYGIQTDNILESTTYQSKNDDGTVDAVTVFEILSANSHIHNFVETGRVEATTDADGYIDYECLCGETYQKVLKAETIISEPIPIEVAHVLATGKEFNRLCGTLASEIDYVEITDIEVPDGVTAINVAAEGENNIVMAWIESKDGENTLYVSSTENNVLISANTDSSYLFAGYIWDGKGNTAFKSVKEINGLDRIDTSKIINMSYMFYECDYLNNLDVSTFETSNVNNMYSMFEKCYSLESLDVSGFNTENVTNMARMFDDLTLTELDVSGFDTSKVTSMSHMFFGCKNLNSIDVSGFDTGNVESMYAMFYNCNSVAELDVSHFDTSKVSSMFGMFLGCKNIDSIDVSSFNTSNVTHMGGMFSGCSNLTSLDVSGFDMSNVEDTGSMFYFCTNLNSINLDGWNTSSVKYMASMFNECGMLKELDLSHFDTSQVTDMRGMFLGCKNIANIDVSGFDTSKVENMSWMFCSCPNLTELDLSSFDTSSVSDIRFMFSGCSNLQTIYASDWTANNTYIADGNVEVFPHCKVLPNYSGIGSSYCKLVSDGGYFSEK